MKRTKKPLKSFGFGLLPSKQLLEKESSLGLGTSLVPAIKWEGLYGPIYYPNSAKLPSADEQAGS
jgi:hypothetical protein